MQIILRFFRLIYVVAGFIFTVSSANAQTAPPSAHDFAQSNNRAFALSPDGSKLAYIQGEELDTNIILLDLNTSEARSLIVGNEVKPRTLHWLNDRHILLQSTKAQWRKRAIRNSANLREESQRHVYSLETRKTLAIGKSNEGHYDIAHLGNPNDDKVIMQYSSNWGSDVKLLVELNLSTEVENVIAHTSNSFGEWVLDSQGQPKVRLDLKTDRSGVMRYESVKYLVYESGGWRSFLEYHNVDKLPFSLIGMEDDHNVLVLENSDNGIIAKYLDVSNGQLTAAFPNEVRHISRIITDPYSLKPLGIAFDSYTGETKWFNQTLERAQNLLSRSFPNTHVQIKCWSRDYSKLIVSVVTGSGPDKIYFFDSKTMRAEEFTSLPPTFIGYSFGAKTLRNYKARDGLEIPVFINFPSNLAPKSLPTIILPHGGPEANDSINYDYISQFLVSRGYLVVQPQFRGSEGNGREFAKAGYGEWGAKMQDDVSDSVKWVIEQGWADPKRVCIVGASYGGYVALAGATMTPELYSCAISYGGVFDLAAMQRTEAQIWGVDSNSVAYWRESIGFSRLNSARIRAVSPQFHAESARAPILLMHGKDDTVVLIEQSRRMADALRQANKNFQYIELDGEDHWLSRAVTRERFLTEIEKFLAPILKPGE